MSHLKSIFCDLGVGDPWGFGHILLKEVLEEVRKSRTPLFKFYCIFTTKVFDPYHLDVFVRGSLITHQFRLSLVALTK